MLLEDEFWGVVQRLVAALTDMTDYQRPPHCNSSRWSLTSARSSLYQYCALRWQRIGMTLNEIVAIWSEKSIFRVISGYWRW